MRDNRVSIDQSTKKQLENMKTALSASKNTKVVEEALALLNWVIEQKKQVTKLQQSISKQVL